MRELSGKKLAGDEQEVGIRPRFLSEYIGQEKVRENLKISIEAAKIRNEAIDHILLHSPPGLGKTTLAHIIANEMGVSIVTTTGPLLERAGDLAAILTNLKDRDIIFIDEIHRLNRFVEETLYPAMEDFKLDIIVGEGPSARTLRLDLPRFTLIGATTRAALLTSPLRDRFGISHLLDFYSIQELFEIIIRASRVLRVEIDKGGAEEIAKRARGTPRVANRLLKRIRDFSQIKQKDIITKDIVVEAFNLLGIDEFGLDEMDIKILRAIIEKFDGGPVGIDALAATISEEQDTIMDVYEPYLLKIGFIQRTPRGRIVTSLGYKHLGLKKEEKKGNQKEINFKLI